MHILSSQQSKINPWTGPEGSSRLRLPDGCQSYAPADFTPRKLSWCLFLLEAESTPGPQCGRKDNINEKFQIRHRESNSAVPQPTAPPRTPIVFPVDSRILIIRLTCGPKFRFQFVKFVLMYYKSIAL